MGGWGGRLGKSCHLFLWRSSRSSHAKLRRTRNLRPVRPEHHRLKTTRGRGSHLSDPAVADTWRTQPAARCADLALGAADQAEVARGTGGAGCAYIRSPTLPRATPQRTPLSLGETRAAPSLRQIRPREGRTVLIDAGHSRQSRQPGSFCMPRNRRESSTRAVPYLDLTVFGSSPISLPSRLQRGPRLRREAENATAHTSFLSLSASRLLYSMAR